MFRLLIADDEYIERQALKSIIEHNFKQYYEIAETANGLDAVEQAKKFAPDIIFMDIKMPGLYGMEAIRQIREFLPEVDIVIITAYDYFDYAKEAISLRASELLLKPIEVNAVIALITKLTDTLKKSKEKQKVSIEIESKLEKITIRFEQEFMELIQNYHTQGSTVLEYLKILDCSYAAGMVVLINFTELLEDTNIGHIQRDFIYTRFLNKVKVQSEKAGIKCIFGKEEDRTLCVFIIPQTEGKKEKQQSDFDLNQQVSHVLEENKQIMNLPITYKCSLVLKEAQELPMEIYRLEQSYQETTKQDAYPYDIEEKCILALEKQNYSEARRRAAQIAKFLRKEKEPHIFLREVTELYAVVKRSIKKRSAEALLPNAEELVEKISQEYDMISFFNRLFDYAEKTMEQKYNKNEILIQQICDYLEEHYAEDISLEKAADRIGFSSFYFAKLMKEYQNMSYVDYISSIRIKKAKELFAASNKTVGEVAQLVGYSDANYFTRVFKKIEGITPSTYKTNRMG